MYTFLFVVVAFSATLAEAQTLKSDISRIIESRTNFTSQVYMSQVNSVQPNLQQDAKTRTQIAKSAITSSSNWNKWLVNVTLLGASPEQREAAKSCYSESDMDAKANEFEAEAKKCAGNNTAEVSAAEQKLQSDIKSFQSEMEPIIKNSTNCGFFDLGCVSDADSRSRKVSQKWDPELANDALDLQYKGSIATRKIRACIDKASSTRTNELNAIPQEVRACMTLAGKKNNSNGGNSNSAGNSSSGGNSTTDGNSSSGGSSTTDGNSSSGGSSTTDGNSSSGGNSNTGGNSSSGGNSNTNGNSSSGSNQTPAAADTPAADAGNTNA